MSSNQKTTGSATLPQNKQSNKNVGGRKKFGVSNQIVNDLRRVVKTSSVWVHYTPASLLKQFEYDCNRVFLPVKGSKIERFDYSTLDVLSLLKTFQPEVHHSKKMNKLRNFPLFSTPVNSINPIKEIGSDAEEFPFYTAASCQERALDSYNMAHARYVMLQHFNIQGEFRYDASSTYMLCVNEALKYLINHPVNKLNTYLFNKLSQYDYNRIDPIGIYMFILHLKIRGLATFATLKALKNWTKAWSLRTLDERQRLLTDFYLGRLTPQIHAILESYLTQLTEELTILSNEAKLIRYPYKIGRRAFDPIYVTYAAWKYGIYDQMSETEKYRDSKGLPISHLLFGEPTMFNIKKGISDTMADAIKTSVSDASPIINEALSDSAKQMLNNPEVLSALRDAVTNALQPTIENFEASTSNVTQEAVATAKSAFEPILNQTLGLFSSLNGLVDFFKSMLKQAADAFPTEIVGEKTGLNISPESLFNILKYYILYVNIESKPIKMVLVYFMLEELGLLPWIMKWGAHLFSMIFNNPTPNPEPVDGSELQGEPTSAVDWLHSLMDMLLNNKNEVALLTLFTSLLALIFKHVSCARSSGTLRFNEYSTIAGIVMGVCKGFHVIGSGVMGIDRIYKYFQIVSKSLTKWIREHFLGIKEDSFTNEKAVSKWLTQLHYFSTDNGRNAIRVSKKTLELAEQIMATGLAFITAASKDPTFISKESLQSIHRNWNSVKVLSNYCHRLRSTSTFKPAMFHVQFVGEPGIGKSTLTEKFIEILSKKIYAADEKVSHWTYNPNVDHFDGYSGDKIMIIDDLFRYNEPKHLSLIIGLITNTPVVLPMAHLEDKGQTLESDILISSTNTPYPIGKDIFCMEAVHRRRHVLVEVVMDHRVKRDGKFCYELFKKFYPGQDSHTFPHLHFNLMKPIPTQSGDSYARTSNEEMKDKYDLIKKLKMANDSLMFEPEFYFGEDARPPPGMSVPCKEWKFNTFIENVAVAYKQLRSSERKLTKREQYDHVMDCFAEIDNLFVQEDDIGQGVYASTSFSLIKDKFLDITYKYGMDDPLGEKIYLTKEETDKFAPELATIDIDQLTSEVIEELSATPTSDEEKYDDALEYHTGESTEVRMKKMMKRTLIQLSNFRLKPDLTASEIAALNSVMHKQMNELYNGIKEDMTKAEQRILMKATNDARFVDAEITSPPPVYNDETFEGTRRQRILNKMKKTQRDPYYEDCAKVKLITTADARHIPAVEISSHYTQWDKVYNVSPTHPGNTFLHSVSSLRAMEKDVDEFLKHTFANEDKKKNLSKFLRDLNMGHKFVFPNRAPYSSEHIKQGNSYIPIEFLRRCHYYNNTWYLDVEDLDWAVCDSVQIKMILNDTERKYHLPIDVAFVLAGMGTFQFITNTFSLLSSAEQFDAVDQAKWLYAHLTDFSVEGVKERLRTIAHTVKTNVLAHAFDTLKWVWSKLSFILNSFIKTAIIFGTIYLLKQVATLFIGKKEPTSKTLHRPQIQVGMRYRANPTNQFLSKVDTNQVMAQNYLDRNIKFFTLINEEGVQSIAHGIHTNQFLIINAHTADFVTGVTYLTYKPTYRSELEWEIEILPKNVYKLPGNDLAIIFSRHLPAAKEISQHFITEEDFKSAESVGELWSLTNFQHQQSIEIRDCCRPCEKISMIAHDGRKGECALAILVEGTTVAGKSGSMLVSPNKKPGHRNIVGIQAWKVNDFYKQTVIYQVVTQEMLATMKEEVQKQVKHPVIIQEGPLVCEPTSGKSEPIFTSHVDPIGSVPADKVVGMIGRTQFKKTRIASIMDADGFTSLRVPAALNPFDQRLLVHEHPMKHSVNKYGTGRVGSFDSMMLEKASQDIGYWLKARLDRTKFRTNIPLEECVTGTREPGSNSVDCRASAGLPFIWDKWPGKAAGKKSYVQINEEGNCVIMDPTFPQKFEETFKKLSKGVVPKHTCYDFPKDELRPYYKALGDPIEGTPPKTRSVTCMNMEFIFAWRRVTLDLFASLHRAARGNFPMGPGINPEGPDWTRLFHYINKHPNVLDFDVSNWDGHMPPELMFAAADVLVILLGIKPDSPEAKVIYSIFTEVLFGHVQFEDVVYKKMRGLVSGFPGTAEINTLVHLILMYYFYLQCCYYADKSEFSNVTDFFSHTSPIFYGDDVLISISDAIISWFNGQTIALMYTEHGYPVTTADKGKDMPLRKDIFDCQFLKSGFNYIHPGRVDRKMDVSVCYDLMYWVRAKEHPYDQFRSNLFDAFKILHGHGSDKFEEIRVQVNSWLREAHLEPFDYRWSDFEANHLKLYYSE